MKPVKTIRSEEEGMQKLLKYIRIRKLHRLDLVLIFVLIAGSIFLNKFIYIADGWFDSKIHIADGYMAKQDERGNTYVIDRGHTRVLKLDKNNNVEFSIRENKREADTISYAGDLTVGANGDIYIEENHWNGMSIDREAILVYDPDGNYKATCYDVLHEQYVNKRQIFGMTAAAGRIYFACLQENSIDICCIDEANYQFKIVKTIEWTNAFNEVYDISLQPETKSIYVLNKKNQVSCICPEGSKLIYDSQNDREYAGKIALCSLTADMSGNIYLSDIKGKRIFYMPKNQTELKTVVSDCMSPKICGRTLENGDFSISAIYNKTIYEIDCDGNFTAIGTDFWRTWSFGGFMLAMYMVLLCFILSVFWLVVRTAVFLWGIKFSPVVRGAVLIAGIVSAVGFIIVTQLMSSFKKIYIDEMTDKLSISAHAVSAQLDASVLDGVNIPEDFMNEDYKALVTAMDKALGKDYEFNRNIYCNILKYVDGEAFSIAYLDQSAGAYFPLDMAETQEVAYVYESGRDVVNNAKNDISGSFTYAKVPVFDDGKVIAVVAAGCDSKIIFQQIDRMQKDIMITLVTIIVVLLFLFGEGIGFCDLRNKYKKIAANGNKSAVPLHMVRFTIFITFLAFNMATSFLPAYAAGLAGEVLGIPKTLAASLPVTLNIAFMGIMSLFCAPLMSRFSFKNITAVSALISFTGDLSICLSRNYYIFIFGMILNGIGVGLITNCMNMFIASSKDMKLKQDGFTIFNSGSISGINLGSMVGASLTGYLGQQYVFAVSSAAWLAVGALFFVFGHYIFGERIHTIQKIKIAKPSGAAGFARFITSPKIWGYILCIQVPYIILNSFIFYYVPLYGAQKGFDENVISMLLMLYSLCSVFGGTAMTNFFINQFKTATIYVSIGMSLFGLLLFAFRPTVGGLVITLIVMGISASFGVPSRSVYFTELPQVKNYDEEGAMGVYNLMDNVGESAGPVIFGGLMASGNLIAAMGRFVAVICGTTMLYAMGDYLKRKKGGARCGRRK